MFYFVYLSAFDHTWSDESGKRMRGQRSEVRSHKSEVRDRKSADDDVIRYSLFVICYTDDLFLRADAKASTIFAISTVSTNYLIL